MQSEVSSAATTLLCESFFAALGEIDATLEQLCTNLS